MNNVGVSVFAIKMETCIAFVVTIVGCILYGDAKCRNSCCGCHGNNSKKYPTQPRKCGCDLKAVKLLSVYLPSSHPANSAVIRFRHSNSALRELCPPPTWPFVTPLVTLLFYHFELCSWIVCISMILSWAKILLEICDGMFIRNINIFLGTAMHV